jgi:type IV pilus assembly protein PilC
MPILGDFLKKYFLTRVALNLSTLVAGGVPILQALEITGDIVGNRRYKDIILRTREGVKAGQTLSSVLLGYPEEFPLLFVQMTVVGERTGHLESTLKNIVILYEKEVDRAVDSFIKLLEPMMILILGGLVAFLAMSLFVPLFQKGLSI